MSGTEKYENLSREALEARLKLAEDICVLVGWTPPHDSERGKALLQLWMVWVDVIGGSDAVDPDKWPHLNDEFIAELARSRDATRTRVLRHFFGDDSVASLPDSGCAETPTEPDDGGSERDG